jgi:hypothetical protein
MNRIQALAARSVKRPTSADVALTGAGPFSTMGVLLVPLMMTSINDLSCRALARCRWQQTAGRPEHDPRARITNSGLSL